VDKALVIPATFVVGEAFPANLPLADGSLKPIADCSQEEVKQAVDEIRAVVEGSQRRLRRAYEEHLEDLEIYAQLAAYLDRYDEWAGIREDGRVRPTIWSVDISEDKSDGR
jgi:hypothetical protein